MKPSEYALDDPIAAIATALAPAALGIVRVTGKGCVALLAGIFSRSEALREAEGNTLVHGWILDDGEKIDEVLIAVYRAPKSFTGEDSAEIIGHGGPATVMAVYRSIIARGFRPAERGEFTFRAFANGKTDLAKSEAVREIIDAKTDTARAHAAGRLAGTLSAEITDIKNDFLSTLAAIEVEIEYPEDEETTAGAFDSARLESALARLERHESAWSAEKIYQDGAKIVLAGKTNAGKSSLFNALLKEDRAIVSAIAGTTRDWLESGVDFAGIPVRLYDTAGLRETGDVIEAEGVERSRALAGGADLVLYLVDGVEGLTPEDEAFLTNSDSDRGERPPVILVWNKADKPEAAEPPAIPRARENGTVPWRAAVRVSAKTGTGIADIVSAAAGILLGSGTQTITAPGAAREAAPGTERQKDAVRTALSFARHALSAAREGFPMDAIAQDLEDALSALGEITGEVTSADILDTVFSGFCVGK
jgi:tRNA modification GTPase